MRLRAEGLRLRLVRPRPALAGAFLLFAVSVAPGGPVSAQEVPADPTTSTTSTTVETAGTSTTVDTSTTVETSTVDVSSSAAPTTAPDPTSSYGCEPDGLDCVSISAATTFVDTNLSTLFDAGDSLRSVVVVQPLKTVDLTGGSALITLPNGTGWSIAANTVLVNGLPQTTGLDGDSVTLTAAGIRVQPSSAPLRIEFDLVMGNFVSPAVLQPPVVLIAGFTSTDVDRSFTVRTTSAPITFNQALADLTVVLRSLGSPEPGQWSSYTINVSNGGPSTAVSPSVSVAYPPLIDGIEVPAGCINGAGSFTCSLASLEPNGTALLTFRLQPSALARLTTAYSVTAAGSSLVSDPQPASNASFVAEVLGSVANLVVTHPTGIVGFAGGRVTYPVTVTNLGPNRARNSKLVEAFPSDLKAIAPTDSNLDCIYREPTELVPASYGCDLGDLAAGSSVVVEFTGVFAPDTPIGPQLFSGNGSTSANDSDQLNNSSEMIVTVGRAADVSVSGSVAPLAFAGSSWSSTIVVQNAGPSPAESVRITGDYSSLLLEPTATLREGTCVTTGGRVDCVIPKLQANGRIEIPVTGTVSPAELPFGIATIRSFVTVESATTIDPDPENNSFDGETTVRANSDMAVRVALLERVVVGQRISFSLSFTNLGPSIAGGVTGGATVSDNFTGLRVESGPCEIAASNTVVCGRIAQIAVGERVTAIISGLTSPDLPVGELVGIEALVDSVSQDGNRANNTDGAAGSGVLNSNLAVSVTPVPSVNAGESATYTLTVRNDGSTRADGVIVSLGSTDGPALLNASCGSARCDIGRLDPGKSWTGQVTATVRSNAADGSDFTVTVSAASEDGDRAQAETTTLVSVSNDVQVTATSTVPVVAGQEGSITFTVRNSGPSDATGVRVDSLLPEGTTVTSADGCSVSGRRISCFPDVLVADRTATFTVRFDTDPRLETGFVVTATAVSGPLNRSSSASTSVEVSRVADLQVAARVEPTAIAGGSGSGSFTVTNFGPSTARNVGFVLTVGEMGIGAKVRLSGAQGAQDNCVRRIGRVFVCELAEMAPGDVVTVEIAVPVGREVLDGQVVPYSLVASSDLDTLPANDRADGKITILARANLTLRLSAPLTAKAGGEAPLAVTVENVGLSTARDAWVEVELPEQMLSSSSVAANGTDCVTSEGARLMCSVGLLPPQSSAVIEIDGVVRRGMIDGSTMLIAATAGSSTTDIDSQNNTLPFAARIAGETVDPIEIKRIEEFTKVGNTVIFEGQVENASRETVRNVYLVQNVPAGQRIRSAAVTRGVCDTTSQQVLCSVGDVEPADKVNLRLTTVVDTTTDAMAYQAMSAYSSNDQFDGDFEQLNGQFVRPTVRAATNLAVRYSPKLVPVSISANGPLLAAAMLVMVFGLGLVGWVRKGRGEDPLALLGTDGIDPFGDGAGVSLAFGGDGLDRRDQLERLERLDRLNGLSRPEPRETVRS